LNGQPGAICRAPDGKVLSVVTLDIAEGQVQAIHALVNPDKLAHVGPVADIWALSRAAGQMISGE
jgi:RNA polymerase sigma-70 factor, ECF subfamily